MNKIKKVKRIPKHTLLVSRRLDKATDEYILHYRKEITYEVRMPRAKDKA